MIRSYGEPPYRVAALHGGPGAAGSAAGLARGIAPFASVLEPFQSAASIEELIAELDQQLTEKATPPVVLIGWSWGAMLAVLFAARHPERVRKLILVGPAAFSDADAAGIMPERLRRMTPADRSRLGETTLEETAKIIERTDTYDSLGETAADAFVDAEAHERIWNEAAAFRRAGGFLDAASKVTAPATVIHGDYDPHPVDALVAAIPHARRITLPRCGHTPWNERHARERFFEVLQAEI